MKKISCIAAALSLCMTIFAGCSDGGSETENGFETKAAAESDSVTETTLAAAMEEDSADVDEAVQSRLDEIAASGAEIDLSKLSFGMTRDDTGKILSTEAEDTNPWYDTYYAVSPQLCSELCSFTFQYNDGGQLYTINAVSPVLPVDRIAECKEDVFDALNKLFGFSEEDWDNESEYRAYAEYSSETCNTNVKVSIYSYDEGEQLTVSFFNLDYNLFNDTENRSVLP